MDYKNHDAIFRTAFLLPSLSLSLKFSYKSLIPDYEMMVLLIHSNFSNIV